MALTQAFKQTVRARVQRGGRYREALFTGAINAYLAGDTASGNPTMNKHVILGGSKESHWAPRGDHIDLR
jgi:hypothetical protein